ncbi:MAG: M3 family oligoendopeptidase [Desulfobulbus sp.]|jgi:oligoendopeptidase F|uniref:M3 family oligoendopeptidase n=1 Tax=Desulfobulbus sp. TaxID=895 RepID=UPI0028493457|nr:M3 family oligoendopeptidase [Desulfobulbus sp.]MDR2549887.1 M3 family oligoendopeptidase [Desulfobulbus sp.]
MTTPALTNEQLGTATVLWDLNALYFAVDSPEIREDMARCRELAEGLAVEAAGRIAELDAEAICRVVERLETIDTLLARLGTYAYLHFITQTGDAAASALLQRVEELEASVGKSTVFFRLEWNRLDETRALELLTTPPLRRYRHYLEAMRRFAPHQLSDKEEELLQELKPVGRSAWNILFEKLFGQLRFGQRGRSEEEVLSDLYHPERDVRKNGAAELTAGLRDNLHLLTQVFNTLAAEKMISDRLRRYPSWDSAINLSNELEGQTVATLVDAVVGRYDIVHRYYRLKKRLLGGGELFDYDRYAPVPGGGETAISWAQCRRIVLDVFAGLSPEMAAIGSRFFDERWIHAPVLAGKGSGAFAHPCVPEVHPYILVNYTGNMRDVATVAHELGHGVHQFLAAEQGFYHSDTPLVLAETASVFAELLVFKAQVGLLSPRARLAYICQKLESIFATVFRQVAMNRFEAATHAGRRQQGELSAEQLSALWLESQRPMFGDTVTLRDDYGLWWAYISHFLSTPGYVYSYAFGELLVLALYARYQAEPEIFVGRYLALLRSGGNGSPYELLRPFAIDLDDAAFWQGGLDLIDRMLVDAEQEVTFIVNR